MFVRYAPRSIEFGHIGIQFDCFIEGVDRFTIFSLGYIEVRLPRISSGESRIRSHSFVEAGKRFLVQLQSCVPKSSVAQRPGFMNDHVRLECARALAEFRLIDSGKV